MLFPLLIGDKVKMNILAFQTSIIMDFTYFFSLHLSLHLLTLVRVTKLLLSFTGTGTDPLFRKCHSDQLEKKEKKSHYKSHKTHHSQSTLRHALSKYQNK